MGDIITFYSQWKMAVIVTALFLFLIPFSVAQNTNSSVQETTQAESSIFTEEDESKLPIYTDSGSSNVAETSYSTGGIGIYVRMIIMLLIIVGLIYLVFYFLKKSGKVQDVSDDDTFLRNVSSISLGNGKSVQIITLIDKAYLIGVSDNSINLISEIQDKELIDALNLYADKHDNTRRPRNFSDVLSIFMPPRKNVFENSDSSKILDSIGKQSNNIDVGE